MAEPVLTLDDLTVRFRLRRGELTAVDGVSFSHRARSRVAASSSRAVTFWN
jgi:ABC-type dipeptide/oligopeptide/nickel transport system ATPase component